MLQIPPRKIATEYVEFPTGVSLLAIFSATSRKTTFLIPRSRETTDARSSNSGYRTQARNTRDCKPSLQPRSRFPPLSRGELARFIFAIPTAISSTSSPPRHGPLTYQPGEHCFRTLPPPGEGLSLLCRDNGLRLAGGSIRAAQKLRLNPQELYLTFRAHPPK